MSKRIDITGASGRIYSFYLLQAGAALTPIGVTYVIGEQAEQGWRVLKTGESSNLALREWATNLDDVRRTYPAAELLIRLNVSRSIREAERLDIAAAQGVLNPTAEEQAQRTDKSES